VISLTTSRLEPARATPYGRAPRLAAAVAIALRCEGGQRAIMQFSRPERSFRVTVEKHGAGRTHAGVFLSSGTEPLSPQTPLGIRTQRSG
jgi:hypothetical protein